MDDYFRRFTFLINKDNPLNAIVRKYGSEWRSSVLSDERILNFQIYKWYQDFFLIIETIASLNFSFLNSILFEKKEWFLSCVDDDHRNNLFPLERIFELDQKEIYLLEDGQLKYKREVGKRIIMTMLLKNDEKNIFGYKQVHSIGKAWPQITENMKFIGVKDMEIYLFQNQAFLIMDVNKEFDLDIQGPIWEDLPKEKEWQKFVSKFQFIDNESLIKDKWSVLDSF